MDGQELCFNGIDGASGAYLLPPISAARFAQVLAGGPRDTAQVRELRDWYERCSSSHFGPAEGVDPRKLEESGWGIIFSHNADPALREALQPLLEHRRRLATARDERLYREFSGPDGHRPTDTKRSFLARHGAGFGPAVPHKVPYYLLIVGEPEAIPFTFQYQLDVQYAVGRLCFDTLEEYACYARSVVAAEQDALSLSRRVAFFAPQNPDDGATHLSAPMLAKPLLERIACTHPTWTVEGVLGEAARKAKLLQLLGGNDTPALLFTASHGMSFPSGDSRQLPHQGALLCQDWPGPRAWHQSIPQDFYCAGDDIAEDARLHGMISFHFACYGAGTPQLDDFAAMAFQDQRATLAPQPFVAQLPKRLLSHPKGGALAIVGHVERAWDFSFRSPRAGVQLEVFRSTLKRLMEGHPVGSALEPFNLRYAELSSDLNQELEEIKYGRAVDELEMAALWTAHNDARSYVVLGDPAVRVAVTESDNGVPEL